MIVIVSIPSLAWYTLGDLALVIQLPHIQVQVAVVCVFTITPRGCTLVLSLVQFSKSAQVSRLVQFSLSSLKPAKSGFKGEL